MSTVVSLPASWILISLLYTKYSILQSVLFTRNQKYTVNIVTKYATPLFKYVCFCSLANPSLAHALGVEIKP